MVLGCGRLPFGTISYTCSIRIVVYEANRTAMGRLGQPQRDLYMTHMSNSQNTELVLIGRLCNVMLQIQFEYGIKIQKYMQRQHARTQRYKCIHTFYKHSQTRCTSRYSEHLWESHWVEDMSDGYGQHTHPQTWVHLWKSRERKAYERNFIK